MLEIGRMYTVKIKSKALGIESKRSKEYLKKKGKVIFFNDRLVTIEIYKNKIKQYAECFFREDIEFC